MIFDMDLDDGAPAGTRPAAAAQSPIALPSLSLSLSRPSSRLAHSRAKSPAPPTQRKSSVSAGILTMLEKQLDHTHIDSDYEDMAGSVHVEVPIVEEYVNDCADDDDGGGEHAGPPAGCPVEAAGAAGPASPGRPRVTVDDFDVLKLIGKGGYGKVYLVQHKRTRRHYAMKVLGKASILMQRRQITFTMTERSILSEVQHPFIVKLFYAFQSNSKLYLIMEYVAGGELFTHMAKERIFSEDQASFYAAELVLAIAHLHTLGIVFRDTKPENCLLSRTGHLVLTDFGLSKTALGDDGRTTTFCGTPAYMAPEVLESSASYDLSVDWWSLGVLIYEMLIGEVPFKGKAPRQIAKNIARMKVHYPNYITPDAKDLVIRLLRKQPDKRIGHGPKGVESIKKHRFFRRIDWARLEADYESFTPPIVPCVSGDADVSNFAAEFTEQQLPPSVAAAGAAAASTAATGSTKGDAEIDPATAFQGFSFVANSVMDSVG
ncbi:hypothetical protein LPJ61_005408 [Coemansia biformis]|uniref:non-specific serine/threonine protein kinase n=1 Tax=Coemansia biformis TaxID=1286918 RepID=A0A9W7Y351_9FUNG|nr:hypothetical protein LPJ61_005408 [Coemansia biformis]